jgi:FKBP-type peptidyl-prolyl cis-trans isomerase
MEAQQGTKFIFFIVPVFLICIIVILFIFRNYSQEPVEDIGENVQEEIFGSEQNTEDFDELNIEVLEEGSGKEAENGDELTVDYKGTLINGNQFDSSYDRGKPYIFVLGIGQVIDGWDQGMVGMKVGEKRKLEIPSSLGYGETGSGAVPGGTGMIFEVELLSID